MKQAEFADLCSVSAMAISKHKAQGRIVFHGGRVDPAASLAALEGHLDESKRRAALKRLGGAPEGAETEAVEPSEAVVGADNVLDFPTSPMARKQLAEAQLRELDLAERAGQLVLASDVEAVIKDAVATFFAECDRRMKQDVDMIASDLNLTMGQAKDLRGLLADRQRRLRVAYAESMERAAAKAVRSNSGAT